MGALLDGLEEEAWGLAVVLPDEAAVGEHGGEVVGEDASLERKQVVPRRRRVPECGLLLSHRDGVKFLEGGGALARQPTAVMCPCVGSSEGDGATRPLGGGERGARRIDRDAGIAAGKCRQVKQIGRAHV